MTSSNTQRVSMTQMMVPMVIMSFTMLLFFSYQLTQVMRDRDGLYQTLGRQDAPFVESQKLNNQFGGLVMGTKKLAEEGNASAIELVKQLKRIGVLPADQAQSQTTSAPVPAAMERTSPGPVKP